ncbi:MAG: hypothetical protein MJ174_00125 [Treponema sp.]|nr:hypothetical protein [Treponema sp.]
MKKILSILAVAFAFTRAIFAYGDTLSINYDMPLLFWNDSSYEYVQRNIGFNADYKVMGDSIGFQSMVGISMPYELERTTTSSGYVKQYKLNSSEDWIVLRTFFGIVFEPVYTDMVEFYITPGFGVDVESVSTSSTELDNITFGAGIDISTYVDLFDGAGFTAGCLFEYQFFSIENNFTADTIKRRKVGNFLFAPRAGMSIKL